MTPPVGDEAAVPAVTATVLGAGAGREAASVDPLDIYRRQISAVPLLSREAEVAIAQRIEVADQERQRLALSTPLGLRWLLRLAAQLREERRGGDASNGATHADPGAAGAMPASLPVALAAVRRLIATRGRLDRFPSRSDRDERARRRLQARIDDALRALPLAPDQIDALAATLTEAAERAGALGSGVLDSDVGMTTDALRATAAAIRRAEHDGRTARRELSEANLRLVVAIAQRYLGCGLALPDLVQEGILGLLRAVDRFRHARGYRFATYATWWIRQGILRALSDSGRTVRVPEHVLEAASQARKTAVTLLHELGREPSTEEVAACLAVPVDSLQAAELALRPVISLETPVDDDGDRTLADLLEDTAASPVDLVEQHCRADRIQTVLAELTPREARVLRLRFGIGDHTPRTLEEVASYFDLTRERIRQIERKALEKLRHVTRARLLLDFVDGSALPATGHHSPTRPSATPYCSSLR